VRELGFEVLEAQNGPAALRLLTDGAPHIDVLITDVVMPGMSGPELAKRARELRDGLKVLYSSGYTPDSIARAQDFGADAVMIAKPFTYRELAEKIAAALTD
jgi:CheY-like chemotaxis protein